MRQFYTLLIISFFALNLQAQTSSNGDAFGVKGGFTIAVQRWNGQDRQPLWAWNGGAWYESLGGKRVGVIIGAEYHQKGSALVNRATQYINQSGQVVDIPRQVFNMSFNNISLLIGGKARHEFTPSLAAYYSLAARLDYTVKYDLGIYQAFYKDYVRRFNYGITLGGGMEWKLGQSPVSLIADIAVSPDFSSQIFAPPGFYQDPQTNQQIQVQEQKVRNITIDFNIGFRYNLWANMTDEEPEEE